MHQHGKECRSKTASPHCAAASAAGGHCGVGCHGLGGLGSACEVSTIVNPTRAFLIRSPDLLWNSRHHSYVRVVTAYGGNQPNKLSGTRDFYFVSTMDSSLPRRTEPPGTKPQ